MQILLVEDDRKIASFIIKGLKQANFGVDHAVDGQDGLHMAITKPYDAAIVDIMLPKLDGLTLTRKDFLFLSQTSISEKEREEKKLLDKSKKLTNR